MEVSFYLVDPYGPVPLMQHVDVPLPQIGHRVLVPRRSGSVYTVKMVVNEIVWDYTNNEVNVYCRED